MTEYYKLKEHEDNCPFKYLFRCPVCLAWKGGVEDLKTHLVFYEKQLLLNDSQDYDLFLKETGIEIFKIMEELYVLLHSYDINSGRFWFTLKYVGLFNYTNRRYFKLTLKLNNTEYHLKRPVEYAKDWKLNKNSANKFYLGIFNKNVSFKPVNVIRFQVSVYFRTPIFPSNIKTSLLEDVTCSVCNIFMQAPIRQSNYGYSMCNKCNDKLSPISEIRNFALESISSYLSRWTDNENYQYISENLIDSLECPVCQTYMSCPIRLCITGHSICNYCESILNDTCPVCRKEMREIRNFALESICNKIHYNCIYADDGCVIVSLSKDIVKHENECSYRYFLVRLKIPTLAAAGVKN
ncbi:hypothetical protein ILUMI_25944 [Ignelater luminosus]|uniref:RING-type domain-containing protein n=1 Tax=Ignelater luminosus TaxID=2038154 RepID=A0A8K0FXL3_IGNLU|nr:hypothetical protein ILUMI_25944 [Ignelater luminosus]